MVSLFRAMTACQSTQEKKGGQSREAVLLPHWEAEVGFFSKVPRMLSEKGQVAGSVVSRFFSFAQLSTNDLQGID